MLHCLMVVVRESEQAKVLVLLSCGDEISRSVGVLEYIAVAALHA